jgi:hypothetical protein
MRRLIGPPFVGAPVVFDPSSLSIRPPSHAGLRPSTPSFCSAMLRCVPCLNQASCAQVSLSWPGLEIYVEALDSPKRVALAVLPTPCQPRCRSLRHDKTKVKTGQGRDHGGFAFSFYSSFFCFFFNPSSAVAVEEYLKGGWGRGPGHRREILKERVLCA